MRNPRNWHDDHKQSLTLGQRAADIIRNGMGSWPFVFVFLGSLGSWAILNTLPNSLHWDRYPFILLNLFLSMLAALQGAILLIAAKRQDAISAAMAKHDYEINLAAKAEIEELMRQNAEQIEAIHDLRLMMLQNKVKVPSSKAAVKVKS